MSSASYRHSVSRTIFVLTLLTAVISLLEQSQGRTPHPGLRNTVSATQNGGLLTGNLSATPASVDLTVEGTTDWAHWGLQTTTDFDHKAGVTQQISNCTIIGAAPLNQYNDNPSGFSWSGGTPHPSTSNTTTGIYIEGTNNGFQLTVPAATTIKTLKLYVGLWQAQGKLEASLSDGSAPVYSNTALINTTATSIGMYTINFQAASSGQLLTIKYTNIASGNGNVTLQAATLVGAVSGNLPPSVSITSPTTGTSFTAPANITVSANASDSDGSISKVDFYQGGSLLGTDTTAPYSFNWTNVAAASYTLTAVATDNSGTTSTSSAVNVSVTSALSVPSAPSNLTATTISSSQIRLNWTDNSNNETGFKIERCGNSACSNFSQIGTVNANTTSFDDTGLRSGRTFRYRIRAYNSAGNSAYSNIASGITR